MGMACSVSGWIICNVCRILVRKPEGERPLGRPRSGRESNIKMDLTETGWDGMDWVHLAQDRGQ
jgi:hypothetical protein